MDKRKLLRRAAAKRSRDANYRDRKRMIVAVGYCDHVWRMDGTCLKCDEPVQKRACQPDL